MMMIDHPGSILEPPRRAMNSQELLRFAERVLADEPIPASECPAGILDNICFTWSYDPATDTKLALLAVQFYPASHLPDVIYDNFAQPDPVATEAQRHRKEIESELEYFRQWSSVGGRGGGKTKRDNAARDDESLLADVEAYRAKHPNATRAAIARALLAKHGRGFGPDALRKRIERLESRAQGAGPARIRRSKAKSYESPDLHVCGSRGGIWTLAEESVRMEMEQALARIDEGGAVGRPKARETRRDAAADNRESLLAAVEAYRKKHPDAGLSDIARALLPVHGRIRDHADPKAKARAIQALTKRIRRAKKTLDT